MESPAWRNLGLWAPGRTYAEAQVALADAVADAAGPLEGKVVVELGCGSGAGLLRWLRSHGAARAVGYDPAPQVAPPGVEIVRAPAHALAHPADVVLAVDAAYHFDLPRTLAAVRAHLRPGGVFAFTDVLLDSPAWRARAAAWTMGRVCGFGPGAPRPEAELRRLLARHHLRLERLEDLTGPVLGGFADHAPRDRLPFAVTASFAGWARATGAARYGSIRARG